MNIRRIIKFGVIALCIGAIIGACGCVFHSFQVRGEAEACLSAIRQIRVGSSTVKNADDALQSFREYKKDETQLIDGGPYLIYSYRFENKGSHLLGILHPTGFKASLVFHDGLVVARGAGFIQDPFQMVDTHESIIGLFHNQSLDESASGVFVNGSDPSYRTEVFINSRASEADHRTAFDYNLSCFTSVIGCRSLDEILPGAKQMETKQQQLLQNTSKTVVTK